MPYSTLYFDAYLTFFEYLTHSGFSFASVVKDIQIEVMSTTNLAEATTTVKVSDTTMLNSSNSAKDKRTVNDK